MLYMRMLKIFPGPSFINRVRTVSRKTFGLNRAWPMDIWALSIMSCGPGQPASMFANELPRALLIKFDSHIGPSLSVDQKEN
jgi:hypothetical protein